MTQRTRFAAGPTPPPDPPVTHPAERAFVVQFRAEADLARGIVSGRVEHVPSGLAALFGSIEQLIDWMRDVIAHRAPPPDDHDTMPR